MLRKVVITPSKNPWASSILLDKKKEGSKLFYVDYNRLNDVKKKRGGEG